MDSSEQILKLIEDFYKEFDKTDYQINSAIRKAIRIARFVQAHETFATLSLCMIDPENERQILRMWAEIVPHKSKDEFEKLRKQAVENLIALKKTEDGNVKITSIPNIINQISLIEEKKKRLDEPPPSEVTQGLLDYKNIIQRLKNYTYNFISRTEKQAIDKSFSFLDKNKLFVIEKIDSISDEVSQILVDAENALNKNTKEQFSYTCLSCRRILKKVANNLYPPTSESKVLDNGEEIDLSEEKYINRLWQFVDENFNPQTSKDLLIDDYKQLGNRIETIYRMESKGVHSEITKIEAEQVLARTYLLLGDLIRIKKNSTVVEIKSSEIDEFKT